MTEGDKSKPIIVHQVKPITVHLEGQPKVLAEKFVQLPDDPEEFSRFCRKYLGLGPRDPFDNSHLQAISDNFDLTPVAFYNPGNHWTLITGYNYPSSELRFYDPEKGIRTITYYSAQRVWYFPTPGHLKIAAGDLSTDSYKILEEPLDQLGLTMKNAVDCGPLSIFAARLVKLTLRGQIR